MSPDLNGKEQKSVLEPRKDKIKRQGKASKAKYN
jgi:hypothetical protein